MAEELKVQIDKRLMRRAFERAAQSYDQAAVLQREVSQRMLERLDLIKLTPALILDAGAGHRPRSPAHGPRDTRADRGGRRL